MISLSTMAQVSVMVVNAFTFNGEGGNPAGVVLDADQYTHEQKQEIAKLGLASDGNLTKETIDGNRDIILNKGMAYMEQIPEFHKDLSDKTVDRVMRSLSLTSDDLIDGFKPTLSDTGNSFIIIPLKNHSALKNIDAKMDLISEISDEFDLIGYYAFSKDAVEKEHDLTARMFAPRYNIPEEAATGMGAGTLGAYLFEYMGERREEMIFEQGYFMDTPSKSEIHVKLKIKDNKLVSVMAGGRANIMKTISINLTN